MNEQATMHPPTSAAAPPLVGRDIVVIGLQPWYYEIGSNCKNIARHLARNNRVLYVNNPINRKTFLAKNNSAGVQQHVRIMREGGQQIEQVEENIWQFYPTTQIESINSLPITSVFAWFNRRNNRRFAKDIRQACAQMGFQNIVLFNDNDIYNGFSLKELLQPDLYIYYCRDYLRGHYYWKKHCDVLEPKLIAKADVAVANSVYLANYLQQHNPNAHYIGQGCNLELFDAARPLQKPADMEGIAGPIVGYVGALFTLRIDEGIIQRIARELPHYHVVLVGPEDEVFQQSTLHSLPNVHFLGRKDIGELPAYVASFDVCINPQVINEVTIGNYPLKVDEYLAMGKPVVATRTEAMVIFEGVTYLARQPEDYPGLIEQALKEDNPDRKKERIALAQSHTWPHCIEELNFAVQKFLSK